MNSVQTTPKSQYRILMVDDDSTIRNNLRDYLMQYHQANYELIVEAAPTADKAAALLAENEYDLIISDINLPDKDGFYILNQATDQRPGIKKALITAYDLNNYIQQAKTDHISNILVKTAPFNFTELSFVVDNLLQPQTAFGLDKYLVSPVEPLQEIILTRSAQIMPTCETLKQFFQTLGIADADALNVVMVEALTNAMYHSRRNPDGSFRYQKGEPIESMSPEEQVVVTYGSDSDKLGISILDQGGNISASDVLYWLERNVSGQSLLDTHGRGIYLIHRLMNRVIINIAKEKATELVLLHYLNEPLRDNKPIYINEISH